MLFKIKKYWLLPLLFVLCMTYGFAYHHVDTWYGLGLMTFTISLVILLFLRMVIWLAENT